MDTGYVLCVMQSSSLTIMICMDCLHSIKILYLLGLVPADSMCMEFLRFSQDQENLAEARLIVEMHIFFITFFLGSKISLRPADKMTLLFHASVNHGRLDYRELYLEIGVQMAE